MFQGGSTITLDTKGRMALPTRYRAPLLELCEGHLVLTLHEDGCVLMYPQPVWDEIRREMIRVPNQDRRTREYQRLMLGYASEVDMDGQGRVLIPPRLRGKTHLDKRVELAGLGNKFEIWNEDVWNQRLDALISGQAGDEVPDELKHLIT